MIEEITTQLPELRHLVPEVLSQDIARAKITLQNNFIWLMRYYGIDSDQPVHDVVRLLNEKSKEDIVHNNTDDVQIEMIKAHVRLTAAFLRIEELTLQKLIAQY